MSYEQYLAQYQCYNKIIGDTPYNGSEPHCERTWDGLLCWNDAQANTTVEQNCPGYFHDFDTSEIASKVCDSTGNWFQLPTRNYSWSNYTRFFGYLQETENIYYLSLVGHALSIVSLSTSVFIFCYLRILSCQRVTLHKNLFCSYIFNSILIIFFLTTLTNHHEFVERHSILHILHQYMTSCNYFWMLCEGVYLHSLVVVAVFINKPHPAWFYMLGWVQHCLLPVCRYWIRPTTLLYIVHGPICVALLLNMTFLLNIMHVLVRKLRDTHHFKIHMYMRAVRAALILVPLLGVQFILIPLRPKNPLLGKIYDYTMHFAVDYQVIACTMPCGKKFRGLTKPRWNFLAEMQNVTLASCYGDVPSARTGALARIVGKMQSGHLSNQYILVLYF
uniref:Calcitonin receptor n=1 Tax=Eptatretus burgeri TaxID=7764 RepID=A0A8C4R8S5_EPTBU